jgi:hypothetical protein
MHDQNIDTSTVDPSRKVHPKLIPLLPINMSTNTSPSRESLEIFDHLKSMILCTSSPHHKAHPSPISHLHQHSTNKLIFPSPANAKLLHGASKAGLPRTYDIVTSVKTKSRGEYRVAIVAYDEDIKGSGKVNIDHKSLLKSGVKMTLNMAMEDLLRKTQEELWT